MHTILIADDDADIRQSVGMVLEDEGYQLLESGTAETTLATLTNAPEPLLVLLDLLMPTTSVPLAEMIAASPDLCHRHRYILFSARTKSTFEQDTRLIELAQTFVTAQLDKPFSIEDLLQCLQKVETTFS